MWGKVWILALALPGCMTWVTHSLRVPVYKVGLLVILQGQSQLNETALSSCPSSPLNSPVLERIHFTFPGVVVFNLVCRFMLTCKLITNTNAWVFLRFCLNRSVGEAHVYFYKTPKWVLWAARVKKHWLRALPGYFPSTLCSIWPLIQPCRLWGPPRASPKH